MHSFIKALLLTAAEYAGIIIASIIILLGGIYIIGWTAEFIASYIPFWVVWSIFFIICFGLLFGALASSPGTSKNQQKK